eukprot:CAMPEP_0185286686 /NCGR_PEP_ID=MMETSP1363-20130426/2392_1 /TAXON_ID=38817 /ORGANISM="Gephyrocapsa oceanica, Strain RCC1303" /LENGTH=565 /DNA_ID=CAMNT_0027882495 /DNA_START=12 /DNA_END=1709 /DNA_ORIENTATION=+
MSALARGETVEVFYRRSTDPFGYFPVETAYHGLLRPRIGKTDCWIRAKVEQDWPPPLPPGTIAPDSLESVPVLVRHTHPHWSNSDGQRLNPDDPKDMVVSVARCEVRPLNPDGGGAHPPPLLSLCIVRWGGEPGCFNDEQWGRASASVSDTYIHTFIDEACYGTLGTRYETISVFVSSAADLDRLQPPAILGAMRGAHRAAAYFLWPTHQQDATADQAGMVPARAYFAAMNLLESAGLPTRFPHPSALYHTLLGKDWQANLCLLPRLRIPPTVTVNRADLVAGGAARTAGRALAALAEVRAARYGQRGEPAHLAPSALVDSGAVARRGVVKLGFSWEAAHVCMWRGEQGLASALESLSDLPGCDAASLLVQDYVPSSFEARTYVVGGKPAHTVYSSFERVDPHGYVRDFVERDREGALRDWMDADVGAMAHAERRIARLIQHWMVWLRCKCASAPIPALRIDCLVKRVAPGRAEVHTLELTELGFSMLSWADGPRAVFSAVLASMFDDIGPTEEESTLLAGPGGYPDLGGGGGSSGGAGVATTNDNESADCASSVDGESSSDCDA